MVTSAFISRDAVSDLALHFLNKMKILVVRDIERDEIEFICKVSQITVFKSYLSTWFSLRFFFLSI